jgi:hypothetical protein
MPRFRRVWSIVLVLAVSLGTVGHAVAMGTMTGPEMTSAATGAPKHGGCDGCADHKMIMTGICVVPYCTVLPSTAAARPSLFPPTAATFPAVDGGLTPGISAPPELHPPRSSPAA